MEMLETGLLDRGDGVSRIVETGVCVGNQPFGRIGDFVQSWEVEQHGS